MSKKLCRKSEKAKAAYKRKRADKLAKQRSILFRRYNRPQAVIHIDFDLALEDTYKPDVEDIIAMYQQQRVDARMILMRKFVQ